MKKLRRRYKSMMDYKFARKRLIATTVARWTRDNFTMES